MSGKSSTPSKANRVATGLHSHGNRSEYTQPRPTASRRLLARAPRTRRREEPGQKQPTPKRSCVKNQATNAPPLSQQQQTPTSRARESEREIGRENSNVIMSCVGKGPSCCCYRKRRRTSGGPEQPTYAPAPGSDGGGPEAAARPFGRDTPGAATPTPLRPPRRAASRRKQQQLAAATTGAAAAAGTPSAGSQRAAE